MANIINKILEIDENARHRIEDAYKKKSEILCDAEQQEEDIKNDILKRVAGRVEKVEEFEKSNADEKLEKLRNHTNQDISFLDKTYNDNHEKWEKEILNNIIPNLI